MGVVCQDVTNLFFIIFLCACGGRHKNPSWVAEGWWGRPDRASKDRASRGKRAGARGSSRDKVASWGRIKRNITTLSISDTLWHWIGLELGAVPALQPLAAASDAAPLSISDKDRTPLAPLHTGINRVKRALPLYGLVRGLDREGELYRGARVEVPFPA